MTIHECKEHGAGLCLNENLIGEIAEANATLANRIAQLEAENEAAHRVIDTFGLSRCGDSHEGRDANGCVTCDDGKPPLSLAERTKWLIDMMPDDAGEELVALTRERDRLQRMNNTAVNVINHHIRHGNNEGNALALIELVMAAEAERDAARRRIVVLEDLRDSSLAYAAHLKAERDAARAWAAACWRAAKKWRAAYIIDHEPVCDDYQQSDELLLAQAMYRRAIAGTAQERRAAEAAEAQERR